MFTRREYDWLERRFRSYDLVYLDPLVCDPALYKRSLIRWPFQNPDERAITAFFADLAGVLKIKPGDASPSSFIGDDGPGARIKQSRYLQRQFLHVVNRHLPRLKTRHRVRVASLQKATLERISDRPGGGSLLIVDAMFTSRATAPEDVQYASQVASQEGEWPRSSECLLVDIPSPLLSLHNPVLALMTDQQVIFNWSDDFTSLLSAGWHPFVRAIGLCSTRPGGSVYLNVLAILARPYPPLHETLASPPTEQARCSLPGTLRYIQSTSLDVEIERVEKAKANKTATTVSTTSGTRGGEHTEATVQNKITQQPPTAGSVEKDGPNNTAAGGAPKADTAATGATRTETEQPTNKQERQQLPTGPEAVSLPRVYDKEEIYLTPVYLFKLCCELNRTSCEGLAKRELAAYQTLQEYFKRCQRLVQLLDELKIPHQFSEHPMTVEKLLPKQTSRGEMALVPSRPSGS